VRDPRRRRLRLRRLFLRLLPLLDSVSIEELAGVISLNLATCFTSFGALLRKALAYYDHYSLPRSLKDR
jgi:hypothetical protein